MTARSTDAVWTAAPIWREDGSLVLLGSAGGRSVAMCLTARQATQLARDILDKDRDDLLALRARRGGV